MLIARKTMALKNNLYTPYAIHYIMQC